MDAETQQGIREQFTAFKRDVAQATTNMAFRLSVATGLNIMTEQVDAIEKAVEDVRLMIVGMGVEL